MILAKEIEDIRLGTRQIIQYLGYIDNMFADIGSISQCHALQKIEKQPISILELSLALSLDHSSVSRAVKGLVAKGYCEYSENEHDKRSRLLSLTTTGKEKVQEIHAIANHQVESALSPLTPAQRKKIVEGIVLYAKALKQIHEQEKNHDSKY